MMCGATVFHFKENHHDNRITLFGYSKTSKLITVVSQVQILFRKKVESLKEVIVEASQKKQKRNRYNYNKSG
jgi:hypothetical protein